MSEKSNYKNKKIYIAGHTGMVGSAITRELEKKEYNNLLLKNYPGLNLINQDEVKTFFEKEKLRIPGTECRDKEKNSS